MNRYLDQSALSVMTERVGLGPLVDVQRVNARNAAHYLTSYLGQGALADLPKGLQRYGSSADIDLPRTSISLSVGLGGGDLGRLLLISIAALAEPAARDADRGRIPLQEDEIMRQRRDQHLGWEWRLAPGPGNPSGREGSPEHGMKAIAVSERAARCGLHLSRTRSVSLR